MRVGLETKTGCARARGSWATQPARGKSNRKSAGSTGAHEEGRWETEHVHRNESADRLEWDPIAQEGGSRECLPFAQQAAGAQHGIARGRAFRRSMPLTLERASGKSRSQAWRCLDMAAL